MKCKFPIRVPYYKDENAPKGYKIVPCGKCIDCRKQLSNTWTFRLLCQLDKSRNNLFVTLTYDNNNVPIKIINSIPYLNLDENKLQSFLKKFRDDSRYRYQKITGIDKKLCKCPMKYFAIGDYGTQTLRPHYHILIFNCVYTRLDLINYLQDNWQLGNCRVDIAQPAHTSYICKYITNLSNDYPNEVTKPFRLMSRGLGLDKSFEFLNDYLNGITSFQIGSFKCGLPSYIRKKLDDYVYSDSSEKMLPSYKQNVSKMRYSRYQNYLKSSKTKGYSKYYWDNVIKSNYLNKALSINKIKENQNGK